MKNRITIILISLLCGFVLIINAQNFIKIDASFYSEVLDEVKNIDIYLPADYYEHPEQQYATIYYLHGGGGNQNSGNTDATFYYNLHNDDTTISSPPAIFVCPDGSCGPYAGSMWANSELYGPFEDYFMQDVIGFVEENFRAVPNKNFRYVVGWSMGGCGAADLCTNHPDHFRACVPGAAGMAMIDTSLNSWRSTCYEENGSYNLSYTGSGFNTQVLFTCAGAWSPNMDVEPDYIEIPFDTLGNWVDTVLTKWYQHDMSRRVKNLPDETELAWFLVCGLDDIICSYPTYLAFSDSLEAYGIGYDCNYYDGGLHYDLESWIKAIHWLDSIIDHSYPFDPDGISVYRAAFGHFNVFPNPASDQLTISYQLKKAGTALVSIFSNNGQLMKTVSNDFKPAGEYRFVLNISDYPQGVYFCRLRSGNETVTKKIIKF